MYRKLVGSFLLVLAFLVLTGARRPAPMYEPPPLKVPEGMSLEEVTDIVKSALASRGWGLDEETAAEDGGSTEIATSLHVRVHSVAIKIAVDTKQIQMTYVSSTNMRYKKTKRGAKIHPKYTTWIKNLELDINTAFRRKSFDD